MFGKVNVFRLIGFVGEARHSGIQYKQCQATLHGSQTVYTHPC